MTASRSAATAAILCVALAGLTLLFATPALAAPDKTAGPALMSATVLDDGTLHSGAGATSSSRTGLGQYTVAFEREISFRDCALFPNVFAEGAFPAIAGTGDIGGGAGGNTVTLIVSDGNTNLDVPFSLLVYCAK